jgi:hypothetical protein
MKYFPTRVLFLTRAADYLFAIYMLRARLLSSILLSPGVGNEFVYSRKKLLKLPYVLIGLGFSTGDYV